MSFDTISEPTFCRAFSFESPNQQTHTHTILSEHTRAHTNIPSLFMLDPLIVRVTEVGSEVTDPRSNRPSLEATGIQGLLAVVMAPAIRPTFTWEEGQGQGRYKCNGTCENLSIFQNRHSQNKCSCQPLI